MTKTYSGIKFFAIIVSIILLIPISINWYSFITRSFSDDIDKNDTPYTSLKYTVLTDSNTTFMLLFDSTVAIGTCRLSQTKNISIPEKVCIRGKEFTVTSIGKFAFKDCSNLTNIEIPESIESIGSSAFEGCSNLTNIEIPESVDSIGKSAFENCSDLTNIEIPSGVTSIEESAFQGCYSLKNIKIPKSVTYIGESAFERCSSLMSIKIPKSVTYIGELAFYGCINLDVVIDNSKDNMVIGEYAFLGCRSVRYTK